MPGSSSVTATLTPSGSYQVSRGGSVIGTGSADYATALGASITPSPSGNGTLPNTNPNASFQVPGGLAGTPVQQTTTQMRQTAATNSATLANKTATIANTNAANAAATTAATTQQPGSSYTPSSTATQEQAANGINQTAPTSLQGTVVKDVDNGDGTHNVSYADGTTDRVQVTQNPDGSNSYTVLSKEAGITYDANSAIAKATTANQQEVAQANSTLDSISSMADAATAALITSIKQTYAARIQAMDVSNQRILSTKTESGYRSGAAQYTSQLQAGVLTDEEQQGVSRIAELQGEMLSAIAQAQQAQTTQELAIFNDRMDALSKLDTELSTTVQNLQSNATAQLAALQTANKNAFDEQQTLQQNNINTAQAAAPGLASQLSAYKTPADQAEFITKTATQLGIDPNVLFGEVQSALTTQQKDSLDLENVKSEITNRAQQTAISAENAATERENANTTRMNAQKATSSDVFAAVDKLITPTLDAKNPLQTNQYIDLKTGYLTADGFNKLVSAAGENNVPRADFIKQYAGKLDPNNYAQYGLTKAEQDTLNDTSKSSGGSSDGTIPSIGN